MKKSPRNAGGGLGRLGKKGGVRGNRGIGERKEEMGEERSRNLRYLPCESCSTTGLCLLPFLLLWSLCLLP